MAPSRSRIAWIAVLAVLVFASAKPRTVVEDWCERLLLPSRFAGELARPLGFVARGSVRAAENALASGADDLATKSRAMLERARLSALPASEELLRGRGFVHAQVVDRARATPDVLTIQFDPRAIVQVGMPAVAGDAYVGRVVRLSRTRAGEAEVELATAKTFRVGAEVVTAPEKDGGKHGALVVGGVAPHPDDDAHGLYLAVHVPSDRALAGGEVRVKEDDRASTETARATTPPYALATGFRLGKLVAYEVGGVRVLAVQASFDFGAGPQELVLLAAPERAEAGPPLARDPFAPERWIATRAVTPGEASALREAKRLAAGARAGVEVGAAVSVAGQLVGRVERASPWSSTASLLGDDGFTVQACAIVEGEDAPRALGRLVSLGRDGDDVLFAWDDALAATPKPGAKEKPLEAELYTASGERAIPPGLHVGATELVRGPGRHVLRVRPRVDPRDLVRVDVWRAALPAEEETP